MLGAAAASALLAVVAIGLWGRILSSSGRATREVENAANQLESTTIQLQEYMEIIELGAAESLPQSAGVDNYQAPAAQAAAPAATSLDDRSEELEGAVEGRLTEIIHQRRVAQLAQGAARTGRPNAY